MPKIFWLVKQEPADYAWAVFVKDGRAAWTGVRNFQARNHLRAMKPDDIAFYYHSGDDKQIVGMARVVRAAYLDPTATEGDWSAVDLVPLKPLARPLALAQIKADAAFQNMAFVRQSRLSVSPVTAGEAARLLALAETKL